MVSFQIKLQFNLYVLHLFHLISSHFLSSFAPLDSAIRESAKFSFLAKIIHFLSSFKHYILSKDWSTDQFESCCMEYGSFYIHNSVMDSDGKEIRSLILCRESCNCLWLDWGMIVAPSKIQHSQWPEINNLNIWKAVQDELSDQGYSSLPKRYKKIWRTTGSTLLGGG